MSRFNETQLTVNVGDEDDVEVTVEFTPGWYSPGCMSGNPDNWYPPEGEPAEIHAVKRLDTGEDVTKKLTPEQLRRIEDQCDEAVHDDGPDYDDDRDERDDYEARMSRNVDVDTDNNGRGLDV